MYNLSQIPDAPEGLVSETSSSWAQLQTLLLSRTAGSYSGRLALALTVLLALPLIFAARKLVTAKCHLRDFPGPAWAAYTRLWLCQALATGDSAQIFVDVNKKHGSIARVGPNHLLISDPDLTRQILAVGSKWRRGPWFDSIRIDPRVSNIVSERDPRVHTAMRRRMAPGYAGKDIEGLEETVDERIRGFLGLVERDWISRSGLTKSFDIATRIQYFTIDAITHICFGRPMGFVESDSDKHNFIGTIHTQLPIAQHFSVMLFLNKMLRWASSVPFLRPIVVPSSADKSGIGVIMGLARQVIDDRMNKYEEAKPDMLGSFLKRGLSPDQAEMEISITLVAGSDTTATALRATLLSIISTPTVYQRLTNEIASAEAAGLISSPIRNSEAQKLPYLQAVIREGLRRFPPITQLREREAPPEGLQLPDGRHIPGGTFVGLNAWGTQLDSVYGADAHVFRPERWLPESYDDEGERLVAMSKVQELVFGHGMTRCLGIPIAMMNMNKMLVELFRRYDIQSINNQRPWKSMCYGIFFQSEFFVRITRKDADLGRRLAIA